MTKGKPIAGTGRIDFNVAGDLQLFEINFIAEQTRKLKRQVRFGRWSFAIAMLVLLAAAWLLYGSLCMMRPAWEMRAQVAKRRGDITAAKKQRADLDRLRDDVATQVEDLLPLVPIAQARVAWAPKLVALSRQLPERMGVSRVQISSGRLFPESPDQTGARSRGKDSDRDTPVMLFTVVYEPIEGFDENPIAGLLDNLRGDDDFMYKMEVADLEGQEAGAWQRRPVVFFRGVVKGASSQP